MDRSFGRYFIAAAVATFAMSCTSTQKNTIYYAAVDVDDDKEPAVTLYRLKIRGESSMVGATMQSGFYDANAVRALYGEVKREEGKDYAAGSSIGQISVVREGNSWRLVPANELFTIVYGADAKAIAQVIRATVEADDFGTKLGGLLAAAVNPTAVADARRREIESQAATADASALADELDAMATAVTGNETSYDLSRAAVRASQLVANAAGSATTFNTQDPQEGLKQALAEYRALSKKR